MDILSKLQRETRGCMLGFAKDVWPLERGGSFGPLHALKPLKVTLRSDVGSKTCCDRRCMGCCWLCNILRHDAGRGY